MWAAKLDPPQGPRHTQLSLSLSASTALNLTKTNQLFPATELGDPSDRSSPLAIPPIQGLVSFPHKLFKVSLILSTCFPLLPKCKLCGIPGPEQQAECSVIRYGHCCFPPA